MRSCGPAAITSACWATRILNYYRRFGWELAMPQRSHTLDRANITLLPPSPDVEVTERWRPHVAALMAMHAREPVRADRDEELFTLVAQSRADCLLVALHGGTAAAYVAVREGAVVEHGGDVAATVALLRRALRDIDDPAASTTDRATPRKQHRCDARRGRTRIRPRPGRAAARDGHPVQRRTMTT